MMEMETEFNTFFVGLRFKHMRSHIPVPEGSVPLVCDGCGATDVVFSPEAVSEMGRLGEGNYELLCNICVIDHLEHAINSGDVAMDVPEDPALSSQMADLLSNPRRMLEMAKAARADLERKGLL